MKLLEADEEVMLRSIIIITQIFVTCKFSGTFAARIAQSALLSWFRHASFLKGDGFVSLKREANHQFHLAQKRQDDQHQTLAPNTSTTVNESAENVAKQEDDNLTPLFEDDIELRANESAIAANEAYDGMLQYSPRATQGCFAYDKAEVRVAFVGDSTSVGYPKKVGHWTRLACSGPCVNGTHPEVDVRHYNFAVASTTVTDSDDNDDAYVRTRQYRRSLDYDPDVVVLMLGTNDALRCDPLEFDVAAFTSSLEALLLSYLSLPAEPDVLVLTPAPVFDSIIVNVTRAASRKHRERSFLRREGFYHGNVSLCMLMVVESIRSTVLRLSLQTFRSSGSENSLVSQRRLLLVDMHSKVLDDLMHDAIREASDIVDKTHRPTSVFQTNSVNSSAIWSELHSASPVLSKYYNECNETKIHFVRSFPVASVAGQRAVFKAMSDGCHYERVLQKKVAAEVMRQLWLDRS